MKPFLPDIDPIRDGLLSVGFREDRLRDDFAVPGIGKRAALVGFADSPLDSRTACIAVVCGDAFSDAEVELLRPLGAPLVLRCLTDHALLWSQTRDRPTFQRRLTVSELPAFFRDNKDQLSPLAVYRAKLWGRLEPSYQRKFVDSGLMPLVEEQAGQGLTDLIERVVKATKRELGWSNDISDTNGRWLLQSTFWLLAAKILQDKLVPGFIKLSLKDVEAVYYRLARHYNSDNPQPVPVSSQAKREALTAAAAEIDQFGNCGCVSTEALAYLYESALIDRETRIKLGTHSTPPWLVDYIVGRLRPWIEQLDVDERRVFEPACGHAAFLISAMRTLSELLPADWPESRQQYLRRRLRGVEIDPFAVEIARLSLTLADVPNPNGWALTPANMFLHENLEQGVKQATIVLGNPPFERFEVADRHASWLPNKAAETFRRVIENLVPGALFGFVMPQTFLHSKQGTAVRQTLLRDFEIAEISLFADKVFRYGEPESAVIIGRRMAKSENHVRPIRYQRIRERQVEEFSRTFKPSVSHSVAPESLTKASRYSLLVPDLVEIWEVLGRLKGLHDYCVVGQGLAHKGKHDSTVPPSAVRVSPTRKPGLIPGFAQRDTNQLTHLLPKQVWLNLNKEVIGCRRIGTDVGRPQVLINYGRAGRDAWRLEALIDQSGHPVTSRFIAVRPRVIGVSLQTVWAICNSPLANAFIYCRSLKRDVLAGDLRQLPVPDLLSVDCSSLDRLVRDYFTSAVALSPIASSNPKVAPKGRAERTNLRLPFDEESDSTRSDDTLRREALRFQLWRIDAEVLRLYGLPPHLERKLLDCFTGFQREGVPFVQTEYFPAHFSDLNRLYELLAITVDWPQSNKRRAVLIDLEEDGQLSNGQAKELSNLQRLADARVSLLRPDRIESTDRIIDEMKRRGLWTEST